MLPLDDDMLQTGSPVRPDQAVYVTRPILPPLAEFLPLLEEIWASRVLSNYGPIHERFERALCDYLDVEHLSLVTNASLGLVLALRRLEVSGEVVTTPFSFVATGHAIKWAGATPAFADIDPGTLNIDPAAVERAITPRTSAILAVHCFGEPCDVAGLRAVADRHGLPLVFDAAHAFGVRIGSRSACAAGDFSVLSFHATKVFNTFEGGAVISARHEDKLAIDRMSNFGILDEENVPEVGLNAKMSEFNAALGLALLPHTDAALRARASVARTYAEHLADVRGIRLLGAHDALGRNNYAFPILVEDAYPLGRDALYARLRDAGIRARRYFYPLISDLPMYSALPSSAPANLPVAADAARRVLCLPMYPGLSADDQMRIIATIRQP